VISLDLFAVLFGGADTLVPQYAADILHVGKAGLGLLKAALPIGSLVCALVVAHLPPFARAGRALIIAVVVFGLGDDWLWVLTVVLALDADAVRLRNGGYDQHCDPATPRCSCSPPDRRWRAAFPQSTIYSSAPPTNWGGPSPASSARGKGRFFPWCSGASPRSWWWAASAGFPGNSALRQAGAAGPGGPSRIEAVLECGELAPAFKSGGKPPHSKTIPTASPARSPIRFGVVEVKVHGLVGANEMELNGRVGGRLAGFLASLASLASFLSKALLAAALAPRLHPCGWPTRLVDCGHLIRCSVATLAAISGVLSTVGRIKTISSVRVLLAPELLNKLPSTGMSINHGTPEWLRERLALMKPPRMMVWPLMTATLAPASRLVVVGTLPHAGDGHVRPQLLDFLVNVHFDQAIHV